MTQGQETRAAVCQMPTFHQCYEATSAAALVACLATDQLQAGCHYMQEEIDWQPCLPTLSSHPGLSTSMYTAIIGQTVTHRTSDGTSVVTERVQR